MSSNLILDILLIVASSGLAVFCAVLGRRLRKLNDLESGLGGAIAVLLAETDRLEKSMHAVREEAKRAGDDLASAIAQSQTEREMLNFRHLVRDAGGHALPRSGRLRRRKEVGNPHA